MKVGVLTLPLHTNYGGILQAFALQTILNQFGLDAEIISVKDWRPNGKKSFFLKSIVIEVYFFLKSIRKPQKDAKLRMFVDKHVCLRKYDRFYDIKEKDFDAIIVGSDQIWRKLFIPKYENVFLDFTKGWKNIKRISYAASFGTGQLECDEGVLKACVPLLKLFNAVSVRESSGVELCINKFGVNAMETLDPTMLFSCNRYMTLFQFSIDPSKKYVLCNVLDESEKAIPLAKALSEEKMRELRIFLPEKSKDALPSIGNWIKNIAEASFVITDSFHVTVFSILFRRPFIVIKNDLAGNTRIESLLAKLNLMDHQLTDYIKLKDAVEYCKKVDAPSDDTYSLLNKLRSESIAFLKNALK